MDYKIVKECRICASPNLKKYLDLGLQPLANSLGNHPTKYPLEVLFCEDCSLSQLSVVVNPDLLYKDYPYHSSVSKTFQKHCQAMAVELKQYFPDAEPLIVDIASNDGCLLNEFKQEGYRVMGVEPAQNLVDSALTKGISTIKGYWGTEATALVPNADVITATNVFAHVDDIHSFLNGVRDKLRVYSKGIFVLEVPYLPNLIEGNQFDTIYHEHLSYFLLSPLDKLFNSCGMQIFRVDKLAIHGGSIRIYSSPYNYSIEGSYLDIIQEEKDKGYHFLETYLNFSNNVEFVKRELKELLYQLKLEGKKVMGYGASAKGVGLLNMCKIERDEIESVVDETPAKQGKTIPGLGIPIVGFDCFDVVEPDYIILLAWNFAKELIEKTPRHKERRGKYIIPIPKVEII